MERYAQEFARTAGLLGIRVNVVTTGAVKQPEEASDGEVRVLRLPAYNVPVMGSSYPVADRGWRQAEQFLSCDVVMAHTRFFMTTLCAARITARRSQRICVVDHGSGPLRSSPQPLVAASLVYERLATAMLKRWSARFFAVSQASANWLSTFGIRDARILPNGITITGSEPIRESGDFREPIIFFAGRLLPEKGIRQLVEATELLVRSGSNVKLRIAGDGPLAPYLRHRSSEVDYINYVGRLSSSEVADELRRATIFVNPSNYAEGLPTILLEAGAAALPVVSTTRGGSPDLVRDGETGWLITDSSAGAISRCITSVLDSPNEAIRRGAALSRLVRTSYTWSSLVRRFVTFAQDDLAA